LLHGVNSWLDDLRRVRRNEQALTYNDSLVNRKTVLFSDSLGRGTVASGNARKVVPGRYNIGLGDDRGSDVPDPAGRVDLHYGPFGINQVLGNRRTNVRPSNVVV